MENQNNENLENSVPELAASVDASAAPVNHHLIQQTYSFNRQIYSGTSWIYAIAAFSLINCVIMLGGSNTRFILGLGFTDLITEITQVYAPSLLTIGIIINVLVSALYFVFGYFARKKHTWAFIITIVFYSLDLLLLLLIKDFMSIAFHGLAIFFIAKALYSCIKLKKLQN